MPSRRAGRRQRRIAHIELARRVSMLGTRQHDAAVENPPRGFTPFFQTVGRVARALRLSVRHVIRARRTIDLRSQHVD